MEDCKEAGLTKSIGVSNFNRSQIQWILNMPGLRHKPVCNQVKYANVYQNIPCFLMGNYNIFLLLDIIRKNKMKAAVAGCCTEWY